MKDMKYKIHIKESLGIGTVFAAIISWSLNHSFWWMFLHCIFSWFYIIYWAIWL